MEPMNAANIAELVGDYLQMFFVAFVAALLFSILAQAYLLVVSNPPTADRLRRRLGRRLRRHFESVPSEKLDAALLAADRVTQSGWHLTKSGFGTALWVTALIIGYTVYRDVFPHLPDWYGSLGVVFAAVVCGSVVDYLNKCSLRRRLERTLHESGVT
jgi:hypothetical protein